MKNILKSTEKIKTIKGEKIDTKPHKNGDEKEKIATIDEYIKTFPPERQIVMERLRTIIKEEAPNAIEKISWGMPTFHQGVNLIHFAQAKNHLGLFPGPEAVEVFREKFQGYKTSKGTIQLPNGKPLPENLIRQVVRYNLNMISNKT